MTLKKNNKRVFLYGVGIVAPNASNLNEFLNLIREGQSALTLKNDFFGTFLAGIPKFDFSEYKTWLEERHGPKRYPLLNDKSGDLIKFGVGSLIQAVTMTPGLESAIKSLDSHVNIQYATGLADLPTMFKSGRELDTALFAWNSFWAQPEKNLSLEQFLAGKISFENVPQNPNQLPIDSLQRFEALKIWNEFWAQKSHLLKDYLAQLKKVEEEGMNHADIESAKLTLIRNKIKARKELSDRYGYPTPPWESVSPNLLWNIPNLASSQASMLLNLHGESFGVSGACGSFGALVSNAFHDIQSGKSKIAILGAVDATPCNELISSFYSGRLAVLGEKQGVPFCDLRGTHIAGGSCTWILGDEETMNGLHIPHLGIEILGAGVSSDAEHIITPSKDGPKLAIKKAFDVAGVTKKDIQCWDMHATGTPGDVNEFQIIEDFVPKEAFISARKGIFGHGMAVCGGWELTAQLLGPIKKEKTLVLAPTGIQSQNINGQIAALNRNILLDKPVDIPFPKNGLICGKLGMGVGGISSCVIAKIV